MNLLDLLRKEIADGLTALYGHRMASEEVVCRPTEKNFEGDYTLALFPFARVLKASPNEIAEKLGAYLVAQGAWVARYEVVGGFLNFLLTDKAWTRMKEEGAAALQGPRVERGEKVVVEFSQPNTNKPLHLGHLRNNFLGCALSNILHAVGYEVERINIMNDRGVHICKSMVAYQRFGEGRTPASEGMKGDHFVGHYYVLFEKAYQAEVKALVEAGQSLDMAKKEASIMQAAQTMLTQWEAGDAAVRALWQQMREWVLEGLAATYARTEIEFDHIYYESVTYLLGKKVVEEGLAQGIFARKADGSVWIDLEEEKLGKKLLLRGNGTSVYITQDMGAIDQRHAELRFDRHIYLVGSEQAYHFEVLFAIMQRLGRPYADQLYHLSYGMVDLPSGKMKSREGTTVDADALLDELVATAQEMTRALGKVEGLTTDEASKLYEMLGIGAIRYFLLRVNPKKRLLFDPKESIDFQGHTASFIQYTHARIATMLKKANWDGVEPTTTAPWHPTEKKLIFHFARYAESLETAARTYNPALLADYVYHLAKAFNHFYATLPIMRAEVAEVRQRRLALSSLTAEALKKAMALLGIGVPEKM